MWALQQQWRKGEPQKAEGSLAALARERGSEREQLIIRRTSFINVSQVKTATAAEHPPGKQKKEQKTPGSERAGKSNSNSNLIKIMMRASERRI